MSTILEKSTSIGVRGEITATYLKKLGFNESQVEVIGCPSMYTYGDFLPLKNATELTKDSTITMSYHGQFMNFFEFIERSKQQYPNYYIIPQEISDLRLLYAGDSVKKHKDHPYYIKDVNCRSYINNRLRMFINVPSWIKFLEKSDFSVGTRIHGSIASVLAGNPTLVFASDSRVRELAEYHNLAMLKITDIDENTNIQNLYESIDFSKILNGHKQRYETYANFMKKNNIPFYRIGWSHNTSFDQRMKQLNLNSPNGVECYMQLPIDEQIQHLNMYIKMVDGKIKWWKKQNCPLDRKNAGIQEWEASKNDVMTQLTKLI